MIGDDIYHADKETLEEAVADIMEYASKYTLVGVHPIRLHRALAKAAREAVPGWRKILEEEEDE